MVWGTISFDSRISLVVISGTLALQRCLDGILWSILLLFLNYPRLTFQQDRIRHVAMNSLYACWTIPWSLHLRAHLRCDWKAIQLSWNVTYWAWQLETIWQKIPQDTIQELFQSMPCWVTICIPSRSGPMLYWFPHFVTLK